MPKENPPSNSKMVSVPRELAERIAKICMFTMYKEDYRAISEILAKPTEQHQGEAFGSAEPSAPKCKACGDTGVNDDKQKDELPSGDFVERGLVACKQCEEQSEGGAM